MGGFPDHVDHVLVVDDNPGDRRFIKEAFRRSRGDQMVHAVDSRNEALDLLNQEGTFSDGARPDVVFLDWRLSRTTGEEVLRTATSRDPPIPVIVMTSSKPELDTVRSSLSMAELYIEKPTEPEGYIDALRTAFDDTPAGDDDDRSC